jgi:hypothetical protein
LDRALGDLRPRLPRRAVGSPPRKHRTASDRRR